jgi:dynein heavy chain
MTSMPSETFPSSILQSAVKMTNEPPTGVKANMRRGLALHPLNEAAFWEGGSRPEEFRKLLFTLIFGHAFVQERRRFGPIGWNIPYGFDDGDLRISARQLHMYVHESREVPFRALQYSIGECNYGGRVTDDKDRRLLMTLMEKLMCEDTLADEFPLSESGTYYVPECKNGSLDTFVEYVESLPALQAPEVFGLHANADISKDLNQTDEMINKLIATSGGATGGSGSDVGGISGTVDEMLSRLPSVFDIEVVSQKYPVSYSQSMNQV